MKIQLILVVLIGTALGLAGCSSVPKAPKCKGQYVPVNSAEHYPQETKP